MEEKKMIYAVVNELNEWIDAVFDDPALANEYIISKNGFEKIGNGTIPRMSVEVFELNPSIAAFGLP